MPSDPTDRPAASDVPPSDAMPAELAVEVDVIAAERLFFFSDAVVAIAITLLALDLPIPTGDTNAAVLSDVYHHGGDYAAFLISFAVIAQHWFGHHRVFRFVQRAGRIRVWTMLWLLAIILIPFATRFLTADGPFQVRFIFYALVQIAGGLSFLMMERAVWRQGLLRPGTPPGIVRSGYPRLIGMTSMFALSIPLSVFGTWAFLCWSAIPIAVRVARWYADRRWPVATAPV